MHLVDVESCGLGFLRPECFHKHVLPVLRFCPCDFEKVVNVIHTLGNMLSSHTALLYPHNTCCHAWSCHLLPVCVPAFLLHAVEFKHSMLILDMDGCRSYSYALFCSFMLIHHSCHSVYNDKLYKQC